MKQEIQGGSGISWATCRTKTPHHSHFYRLDALSTPNQQCQLTKGN